MSASLLIQICKTPVSSEQEVHTCTGTESQGKGTRDSQTMQNHTKGSVRNTVSKILLAW